MAHLHVDGCSVSCEIFAEQLNNIDELGRFSQSVKYLKTKVSFNNSIVSSDPDSLEWDYENELFYYKDSDELGILELFNIGVEVSRYHGIQKQEGVLVSKVPFKLNMARNSIDKDNCDVWKSFEAFYVEKERSDLKNSIATKKKISPLDVNKYVEYYLNDELSLIQLLELKTIRLTDDSTISLYNIFSREIAHVARGQSSKSPLHAIPDKLNQFPSIIVLDSTMDYIGHDDWNRDDLPRSFVKLIELLCNEVDSEIETNKELKLMFAKKFNFSEYDLDELVYYIQDRIDYIYTELFRHYSSPSKLIEKYDVEKEYVKPKEFTDEEKMLLACANSANNLLSKKLDAKKRKIIIGRSFGVDHAWTDGNTFIAIDIELLRSCRASVNKVEVLVLSLLHEYCHNIENALTNKHNIEFYKDYHNKQFKNISLSGIHSVVQNFILKYVNASERIYKKIPSQFLSVKYGKSAEKPTVTKERVNGLNIIKKMDGLETLLRSKKLQSLLCHLIFVMSNGKLSSMKILFRSSQGFFSTINKHEMELKMPVSDDYLELYLYFKDLISDLHLLGYAEQLNICEYEKKEEMELNESVPVHRLINIIPKELQKTLNSASEIVSRCEDIEKELLGGIELFYKFEELKPHEKSTVKYLTALYASQFLNKK